MRHKNLTQRFKPNYSKWIVFPFMILAYNSAEAKGWETSVGTYNTSLELKALHSFQSEIRGQIVDESTGAQVSGASIKVKGKRAPEIGLRIIFGGDNLLCFKGCLTQ